jgi:hypothetical protein
MPPAQRPAARRCISSSRIWPWQGPTEPSHPIPNQALASVEILHIGHPTAHRSSVRPQCNPFILLGVTLFEKSFSFVPAVPCFSFWLDKMGNSGKGRVASGETKRNGEPRTTQNSEFHIRPVSHANEKRNGFASGVKKGTPPPPKNGRNKATGSFRINEEAEKQSQNKASFPVGGE